MTHTKLEYADVILPLAVPLLYTYKIPLFDLDLIKPGMRVLVQLGKKKVYTAIVHSLHNSPPKQYEVKEIQKVLDNTPIIPEIQLKFWDWIAEYYMCSRGEVMKAALPAGLKLESETHVYAKLGEEVIDELENDESLIFQRILSTGSVKISEIAKLFSGKNITPIIQSLIEKQVILAGEEIKEKFKPKIESYITLNGEFSNKLFIEKAFEACKSAPKQQTLFLTFLDLQTKSKNPNFRIKKKDLITKTGIAASVIKELIKKDVLNEINDEVSRIIEVNKNLVDAKTLNTAQIKALQQIHESFTKKDVTLLHGVTASGKTEVYIQYIKDIIAQGKQVLYLLPEIALTTQITQRLQKVFGNKVGIYHSRLHDNERIELWKNLNSCNEESFQIILGVRSAIFLPFSNLGAIIIDEEHETSFKQYDPAPRYNARDSAIVMAKLHNAKTLLGTATPSIETYYNVLQKKYALVELTERHGNFAMPTIEILDLAKAYKQKRMQKNFSKDLLEKIQKNLEEKRQVILFQNRRGYSPYIECTSCGTIPHCIHCDVSLTYHKYSNTLSCHYCGYTIKNKPTCIACGDSSLETMGFGTEKIEEDLKVIFPKSRIARMDLDTTRGKNGYSSLIERFENREIDILIGTQMISKGLDFDNVGLVSVLNADNLLHMPDFRAFERGFHLMVQVAGRAGRSEQAGDVAIQTFSPLHSTINQVKNHDYNTMMKEQLEERQKFIYPPFVRLIKISLKHRDKSKAIKASDYLRSQINNKNYIQILGPEFPPVGKIQNMFVLQILLKVNKKVAYQKIREELFNAITLVKTHADYKSASIHTDVDPY